MPWPVPEEPKGTFRFVTTNQLRSGLSEEISRAAFGNQPTIVMRRGRKLAAILSMRDVIILEKEKMRLAAELASRKPW